MSAVGNWVSPERRNLATVQNDPFDIIFGDSNNPGQLLIETPANNPPITSNHEGVYTCVIPDENGQSEYLHIGLYLSASKFIYSHITHATLRFPLRVYFIMSTLLHVGTPSVASLRVMDSGNTSVFTLNCISMDSPATTVIWTKDGEVLSGYVTYQILRDGRTATYDSFLNIEAATPDELIGTYTCRVLNSAGQSNMEQINIQGTVYELILVGVFI